MHEPGTAAAMALGMMREALALAQGSRFRARPNPHVGCIVWRDGRVIGAGATQAPGGPHAEVAALADAAARGETVTGAHVAVTLEPCCHQGRTGPCTEALIAAGVGTVHVACEDPNPQVNGRGIARLRSAGITVHTGVLADEAAALNAGFFMRMRSGRPRIRLKLAMSLDGRTAMASGESRWITGAAARADVQRLRAESCAIVTGVGTVRADDCRLTVRAEALPLPPAQRDDAMRGPPLRVVLDSGLRTPVGAAVLSVTAGARRPTVLVHRRGAAVPPALAQPVQHGDIALLAVPEVAGRLDLAAVVAELARRQCNEILLECGATLAGAFMQQGLVDQMVIYIAPTLLGSAARPLLELSLSSMAEQRRLRVLDVARVGDDWRFLTEPL